MDGKAKGRSASYHDTSATLIAMQSHFDFAAIPPLYFGAGKVSFLPSVAKSYGNRILLVRGSRSFDQSESLAIVLEQLSKDGFDIQSCVIDHEPTPQMIDRAVSLFTGFSPAVVAGIGGGSVLDAAKAISAMLPLKEPVRDYLEGVGGKTHPGIKVPFVAIPTTSGTGSEATKNAVLSEVGRHGYKKSLRHKRFVPDAAIVDPRLAISCPPSVTASSGMDAFTQLLESYVSTAANPVTDALAIKGLELIERSLLKAYRTPDDIAARTDMALAAYLSGITLANAGLGLVHGFASSIGGRFNIQHGMVCSRLMYSCNRLTIEKLREEKNQLALAKFARVGRMFRRENNRTANYYVDYLLDFIRECTKSLAIPSLGRFGVVAEHISEIVETTENKNNPALLNRDEMAGILSECL
jgi:alcohol dehydrogenase class IV